MEIQDIAPADARLPPPRAEDVQPAPEQQPASMPEPVPTEPQTATVLDLYA